MAGAKMHADDTAGSGAGSRQGQDQNGRAVDLCAGRSACRISDPHLQCGLLIPRIARGEHPRQHLKDFRGALQA